MIEKQFLIDFDEYYGDFDLGLTMNSGQTSQPPWKCINDNYYEVLKINSHNVLVKLHQDSLNDPIIVTYYAEDEVKEVDVKEKIFYIFDLDYNITLIYDYLTNDTKLNNVYTFNKGLRLFKAQFPFECIISSITSANNSIKRWTKSINDIRINHGEKIDINQISYYLFPKEEDFINISENSLKEYGVGYRSQYMLNSTRKILSDKSYHKNINKMSYEDSFNKLIELEGVGPKVADCILLYGYNKHKSYPVDVWINRITTYLYFNGKKPSNNKIRQFAQNEFGDYAGYIQLYLFNYARLSGLMDKLKENK